MNRKKFAATKMEDHFSPCRIVKRHFQGIKYLLLLFFLFFWGWGRVSAQYSGGDGSQTSPFQISNVNDLIELSQSPEHWAMWFEQTADIYAAITQTLNSGAGFSPIGNGAVKFTGNYNGNNYAIVGLYINRPSSDSVGFFGVVINTATISNLWIIDANITGKSFVGILVGRSLGGQIINCHTSGTVHASDPLYGRCGGLIGANGSVVMRCSSSATVSAAKDIAGGLLGMNIQNVSFSFATGNVTGQNTIGGFVGSSSVGTISQCFSMGVVNGQQRTGGFIGNALNTVQINNSYSLATISGNSSYSGGFVGLINSNNVIIDRCYSNTSIANTSGVSYVGGFAGEINIAQNVQNSFWNTETSGVTTSAGGVGKTDAEMKNQQTFLNAGWDFACETVNGSNNLWGINSLANGGYPFLIWQGYPYDDIPPVIISSPNDTTLFVDNNCEIELPDFRSAVQVSDNCTSTADIVINQIPSPGVEITSTTLISIQVIDQSGNSSIINFNVFLEDNTAPEILSVHGNVSLEANEDCQALLPDYRTTLQAIDNCTPPTNLTITQTPNPGTMVSGIQPVVLRVLDAANNYAEQSFLVTVVDNMYPTIVCPQDTNVLISTSLSYYVVGDNELMPLLVHDNCGLELVYNSFNNASSLTGVSIPLGTHTIQWTAVDLSENISSCSFTLTVAHPNSVAQVSSFTDFQAYPNPVSEILTIIFGDSQPRTLSIMDLAGRCFLQINVLEEKFEFNLSSITSGVYILQVKSPSGISFRKVVKN